jgi:PAS domain S-box-containing protein
VKKVQFLAQSAAQTLEDLRSATDAAWLWDGARGRIVWANAAGIAAFDGQSIFDLIDRPFDVKEPGIERVAELTQTLQSGESQNALLHFPSTGQTVPMDCRCSLHALADGRAGLLVVARNARAKPSDIADHVFVSAFAQLPAAVAFLTSEGVITDANAAAADLFAAGDLAGLLDNENRAAELLQRLQSTNLVSSIENIKGRIGKRDVRLTLRRLSDVEKPFAVMMLDDITERRLVERQMSGVVSEKPVLAADDAQTFESLARTLKAAIKQDAVVPAKIEPPKPAPPAPAVVPAAVMQVPKTVRDALEQTGAAIAIAQNGAAVFASQKAAQLMGYNVAQNLLADQNFWRELSALQAPCAKANLRKADGSALHVQIEISSIPWVNGPAKQYLLSGIVADIKITAPVVEVAPPAPIIVERPVIVEPAIPVAVETAPPVEGAEDELKNILDIASDGIITLDRAGKILSFSAGAEAIFGYRIAEVMDRPLVDFMAPESRKSLRDYLSGLEGPGLAAVFNDGREMTAIVKQGGTVPLFLTIGRLQSLKSTAAFCAVVRDITTWKRTEKELREAKDVAEEASRQKSEFLARISHELRTPLNAIMGFSEVMRLEQFGEIKNDKYRGYVNDIHASGGHLLSLINDLLDLSKIEAGKMELNFTAVNIADVTDHAARLLQDVATRGRVLVRKSFPDKLPRVVADLRAMRQVMINLLSNAIKFTDPGGQVIVSASVSKSGELSLRMKDTGIGMNAAQLQDALEPFKRVETSGRETQGTGLGLPLTKALVEANRAKFDLSSEPGQGTLIEITFPTTRVLAE